MQVLIFPHLSSQQHLEQHQIYAWAKGSSQTTSERSVFPQQEAAALGSVANNLAFSVVALRKIDTIHHPSVDKSSQPPEVFPKSPPAADTPQKTPVADRPQLGDLPPKPQPSELPPKPGELPPKPQLSDLPPKPQLGDLPPKPHLKDLPPKPHLADIPPKPGTAESAPRPPPGDMLQRPQTQPPPPPQPQPQPQDSPSPSQQVTIATTPQPAAEDTNGTPAGLAETPVPLPRKINTVWNLLTTVLTRRAPRLHPPWMGSLTLQLPRSGPSG